jgi:aminopeptidase
VEDGHINMPGGEIYTAPVENSAEGETFFETPGVYARQLIHEFRFAFSDGKVVNASAETNETSLHQLIIMDEGAKRLGEFGVGSFWLWRNILRIGSNSTLLIPPMG